MNRIERRAAALLAALLLGGLGFCTALAEEPEAGEAPELTAGCTLSATQNQGDLWALTDRNRTTRFRTEGETAITVVSPEPVSQLYLIWDQPPGEWTLSGPQGESLYGAQGFLHEYVALESPRTEFTLIVTGEKTILCDLYAFGAGETPHWVQRWQPPYEDADMLLLPTHADDEHLYFGGAMPAYGGERGLKVQVAYLTNHWAEPYRPHELLNGLWTVGITAYPVISDFVDAYADNLEQAKALYPEEEVLAYQVELLRRFRPEVVVGHDVNGEYGHGVHIYNTYALKQAVELAADPEQHPESARAYGAWDVPKTYLHLYGEPPILTGGTDGSRAGVENPIRMDWNQPLARFGGRTALEMAAEGFRQHASQQEFFRVEDSGPYDCALFGLYRSTVGPDIKGGDFLEHIEFPRPEPPEEPQSREEEPEPLPEAKPAENQADEAPLGGRIAAAAGVVLVLAALIGAWAVRAMRRGGKHRF